MSSEEKNSKKERLPTKNGTYKALSLEKLIAIYNSFLIIGIFIAFTSLLSVWLSAFHWFSHQILIFFSIFIFAPFLILLALVFYLIAMRLMYEKVRACFCDKKDK